MLEAWPIMIVVLVVAAFFAMGYFMGKDDGCAMGDVRAEAIKEQIGCRVEVIAKRSRDERWRLSVEPFSAAAENAADWITCGDGFKTVTQAEELAKFYWPTCTFTIDDERDDD